MTLNGESCSDPRPDFDGTGNRGHPDGSIWIRATRSVGSARRTPSTT